MFLSGFVKNFLAFAFLFCSSCGGWQSAKNINSPPHIAEEAEIGIPFQNKEPDEFQADVVVTNFLNGEKIEKRYFLARRGSRHLTVFNRGEKTENSILETIDGRVFFIDKENKIYRESPNQSGKTGGELNEFLTTEWLNQKRDAAFENLGAENSLTKYRVRLDDSTNSEILIFVDENLKLPVKQEFYSVSGEQKTLTLSVEIKNFLTSADENLFILPQDYKRSETK